MSDRDVRALERAVDADRQDTGSRMELTASTIRSGRGSIAWWHGAEKVHPSATRIRLESTFQNELTKEWVSDGSTGWGVSVASAGDLVDLAQRHRMLTLLDLETGRWALVNGSPSPQEIKTNVVSTTVDASGRARSVRGHETDGGAVRLLPTSPFTAAIAGRLRSEPLFDTEWVPAGRGLQRVELFQNNTSFMHTPPGGVMKVWGVDTNLHGQGGGLPATWRAYIHGISLTVADAERRAVSRDELRALLLSGSVRLALVTTDLCVVPLELVVSPGAGVDGEATVVVPWQPPPIYCFAWPVQLDQFQAFRLSVQIETAEHSGFHLRGTLHSQVSKGLAG